MIITEEQGLASIVGLFIGLIIGGITVLNSFDNHETMAKEDVRNLLISIEKNNPDYFYDVITESNEYDVVIDWINK